MLRTCQRGLTFQLHIENSDLSIEGAVFSISVAVHIINIRLCGLLRLKGVEVRMWWWRCAPTAPCQTLALLRPSPLAGPFSLLRPPNKERTQTMAASES